MIMCFILILSTGCSGVKITGEPFYKDGEAEELAACLKQGVDKLTKQDIRMNVNGRPELFADANSERWVYKYSEIKTSTKGFIVFTKTRVKTNEKSLELVFDKNGLLKSYKLNDKYVESDQRDDKVSTYSKRLTEGLLTGAITASIFIIIEMLRSNVKK